MHSFFQPRTAKRLKTTDSSSSENNPNDSSKAFDLKQWQNTTDEKAFSVDTSSLDPIHPTDHGRRGNWQIHQQACLIRFPHPGDKKEDPERTKIAALDMDGTLLEWRAQFPSRHEQVELFNAQVIDKLRKLYDEENYKLVIVSNQGGIRSAFTGKRATFAKSLVDWLEAKINRPIYASLSTSKNNGYHKPSPKLWLDIIQNKFCAKGQTIDTANSLFVGDSVETEDDPQGGVDVKFARNVGELVGTPLAFYTPNEFFGPSHKEQRSTTQLGLAYEPPPKLSTRQDFICGTLQGPVLLILVGVQGAGKSYFCDALLKSATMNGNDHKEASASWVQLSQDVLKKREKVEAATREALQKGQSVVVDRMHLDDTQRAYFVHIAKELNIPVHCLVLQAPSTEVLKQRVRQRTNHAVMGDKGAAMAVSSLDKLVFPKYSEGFSLISASRMPAQVERFAQLYSRVTITNENDPVGCSMPENAQFTLGIEDLQMPALVLGTMDLGRKKTTESVQAAMEVGIQGVDTAPTYKNEDLVGKALADELAFVIAKIPKRATSPEQVRQELMKTIQNLQQDENDSNQCCIDLLLLHWPSDVIAAGTLATVWSEMEKVQSDGLVKGLGVCNFNVDALRMLLPHCRKSKPLVNQVERHLLLPQWDLVDFCAQHDILLQAHSPLGQGKLLAHPAIQEIAGEESTPASVLLRWNLQQGVAVVPRSSSREHIQELHECLAAQPLTKAQMKALNDISETKRFVNPPFMKGSEPFCWSK